MSMFELFDDGVACPFSERGRLPLQNFMYFSVDIITTVICPICMVFLTVSNQQWNNVTDQSIEHSRFALFGISRQSGHNAYYKVWFWYEG